MNQIFSKYKDKILDFFVLLIFSIFVYSELMVNQLVNNYDGIWEGTFHIAGNWELSIGRWFWYYLSKLRFGIAADPVVSIISLALFVLGIMLLEDLMEVKDRLIIYVAGAAFICTPLVCMDLSYRFMSPTFATAFFLAVLGVYISIKMKSIFIAVPLAGLVISLSLGSYQAYLGVSCVIALTYFIKLLYTDEKVKNILITMIRPVLSIILGGILYIVLLNYHLKKNGVIMSDYMGASSYTLGSTLKNFPVSFRGMYQIFHFSMNDALYKVNRLGKFHINYIIMGLFAALLIFFFVKITKKNFVKILLVVVTFLLLPPAMFAVKFITVGANVSLQMTGGFFVTIPALLCALPLSFDKTKLEKVVAYVATAVIVVFVYGGFYQVQAEQSAMYEGRRAVESITDAAIDKLIDEDLFDPAYTYCFYGTPTTSDLYWVDSSISNANVYAIFGAWWPDYSTQSSWEGFIHNYMNLNLTIVDQNQYNMIATSEELAEMPRFPEEGSIKVINDIVVVKIGQ